MLPSLARWGDNALVEEEEAIHNWVRNLSTEQLNEVACIDKKAKRNATWLRDELILALDLYVQNRRFLPGKGSAEIAELSEVLNQLGTVLGQRTSTTYRNANGVYMKLMNFRRFDPEYTADGKKGLTRGNQDELRVWDQFADSPTRLSEVARFIRQCIAEHKTDDDLAGPDEPGIEEAEEGKVATRIHRYSERDRRLVAEVKAQALKEHGRLFCSACGFDFSEKYGEVGTNLIDVHHIKPIIH